MLDSSPFFSVLPLMNAKDYRTQHPYEVVISLEEIQTRVQELGAQINCDYEDAEELVLLVVLQGSIVFAADLMRQLSMPVYLECLRVASYHGGTISSGQVDFEDNPELRQLRGKRVMVIEDILDTGRTLHAVLEHLRSDAVGAADVRTCVLLNKKVPRAFELEPDYQGFEIEDLFVVGYGLDYNGHYRNLPFICALDGASI